MLAGSMLERNAVVSSAYCESLVFCRSITIPIIFTFSLTAISRVSTPKSKR